MYVKEKVKYENKVTYYSRTLTKTKYFQSFFHRLLMKMYLYIKASISHGWREGWCFTYSFLPNAVACSHVPGVNYVLNDEWESQHRTVLLRALLFVVVVVCNNNRQ